MDNLLNANSMSLARVLLIFYVLVASNYTPNLMGKQLRTFLQENRIAQHIIAFIMMLVLIIIVGNVTDIKQALSYSILGYLWFIFTTKMDIQWNLIIILALLVVFIYENNLIEKETEVEKDGNLTIEEKAQIVEKNKEVKTYVILGIIAVTLIGMFFYITKKEEQYGGGKFNLVDFLIY
ncbi:hypothetical protein Catovirus_1_948 [Catovirus CTV1]|uniref:Uncharacterized protein n=1 Tax=Catovirus CTV1 TaxID=1977631 RepID=A0A1V0SB58_9VIRU|nr:hypothetical protein Catovirus_1_948 [Catovirus CTV1]